jgi:hypothetical protein
MDRVALVRSVHHDVAPIHETGLQLLQTGRLCQGGVEYPHFGSVVAQLAGTPGRLPPSVILPGPITSTGVDVPRGQSAGCLGTCFDPTFPGNADLVARRLAEESPTAGAAYGPTSFGRSCLLARRLVELGVRVVTVNAYAAVFRGASWDAHGAEPFGSFDDYARDVLPTFDRAFAALLDDLDHSGRLESTLVVAAGEFGRTPRINASGGRDHWPGVWSVALAGGGVRGGQVIGRSDAHAAAPADGPVTLPDLLATIYHSLGIEGSAHVSTSDGQWFRLVEAGDPIREVFA